MNDEIIMLFDRAFIAKYAQRQVVLNRELRRIGEKLPGRLAPEQATAILILAGYGHGVTIGEIGEEMDLPHTNISRTVDRLEKKGLVRKSQGKKDRRQILVRLTLEGGKIARELKYVYWRALSKVWEIYSDDEKNILADLLMR